ncbi:hypothetical protein Geob_1687 [Geotalea daltonii FRC-32]|uniref:Outer membrane protein beta-barrel domain-containing protein n=1 Tax=Geotalea daltonii (strain DSM 22248 / JCM 15807 / FRC-32) TaxID=316067 RepID=B9M6I5_GEODF|nr:hypothetical protein [Geotalea daltonii]ACM20045.1 hypothetical protein Geob_1687 [Geotalea daltonii FRC-32]
MGWVIAFIAVMLAASPAAAIDLGAPKLSESLASRKFFDPDRYLLSVADKYQVLRGYTLQPQVGLGYVAREREAGVGFDESLHKIQAHAGGRLDLDNRFYFSAAAKLPVYTYGLTDTRLGLFSSQNPSSVHRYDFAHLSSSNLLWTGELGIHLGLGADLTIYYDQNAFDLYEAGRTLSEERIGTRIIFRFK